MKKFKFRLEKVLQYKKGLKEEREKELMEANGVLYERQSLLESLEAAARGNSPEMSGGMSIESLHLSGLFGMRIVEEIANTTELILEAEEIVSEAMEHYLEASKELETFETLKRKKYEAFVEMVRKEEEKFLDELVIQKAGRAASEGLG
jgi:flagellar export protein FliJ